MSSELEGATDIGNPAAFPATPGEFAARWNAKTEEQRAALLHGMISASERAELCRMMHDGQRWVPAWRPEDLPPRGLH